MQNGSSKLSAEDSVDEGVDGGVYVADPENDVVDERGRVQLKQARQRHPDEEWEPRDQEDTDHDAQGDS